MPFDPLAREVVRHGENERLVGELSTGDIAEPGAERGVVQRALETARDFGPETFCCQLLLARHAAGPISSLGGRTASITASPRALNEVRRWVKLSHFAGIFYRSTPSSTGVESRRARGSRAPSMRPLAAIFQTCKQARSCG